METFFVLVFIAVFTLAIYKMINQISKIIIRQQLTVTEKCLQPLIVITFLGIAWLGSASLLGYILSLIASAMLILSLYNKGLTKNGIIPHVSGSSMNGLISREFKFKETSDWLIIEKKKKIKVRFTSQQYKSVYYIDFSLVKKEEIVQFLEQHNQIVTLEKSW